LKIRVSVVRFHSWPPKFERLPVDFPLEAVFFCVVPVQLRQQKSLQITRCTGAQAMVRPIHPADPGGRRPPSCPQQYPLPSHPFQPERRWPSCAIAFPMRGPHRSKNGTVEFNNLMQ
jgi:hypothetical protein